MLTYEEFIVPERYWDYCLEQHRIMFINKYFNINKKYPSKEEIGRFILCDNDKEKFKRMLYGKYLLSGNIPDVPVTPDIPSGPEVPSINNIKHTLIVYGPFEKRFNNYFSYIIEEVRNNISKLDFNDCEILILDTNTDLNNSFIIRGGKGDIYETLITIEEGFEYIKNNDSHKYSLYLYSSEIFEDIINNIYTWNKKLEYIILDSNFTSDFELCMKLGDVSKYLITTPQETFMTVYSFYDCLSLMLDLDNFENNLREICRLTYNKCENYGNGYDMSFSLIKTDKINELKSEIDLIRNNIPEGIDYNNIQNFLTIQGGNYYDLWDFINKVYDDNTFIDSKNKIHGLINEIVIALYTGDKYWTSGSGNSGVYPIYTFCGLIIYIPNENE